MAETILVVNAGSSSIKFQLFGVELLTSLSGVSEVKSKVSVSSPDCLPRARRGKSLSGAVGFATG